MTERVKKGYDIGFICEAAGPNGLYGVFEDDGETGYLYSYEPNGRGVINHLHIYDRNGSLEPEENDVRVVWSCQEDKIAVLIWKKFRGIINVSTGKVGRVWMDSKNTPGIDDKEWLRGLSS